MTGSIALPRVQCRPSLAPALADRTADSDFAAIYREHLEYVMKVLADGFDYQGADGRRRKMWVDSASDLEELVQEAFSVFFRQYQSGRFDRSRPVRPYLRGIAVKLAMKRYGKAGRELLLDVADATPASAPEPMEHEELRELMAEFRSLLSDDDQAVLEHYFAAEERTTQEAVGQELGRSRDQVYRSIVRIRKRALDFFKGKGWLS